MAKQIFRVYRTDILDGTNRFYIGFSGKSDKDFESYFGSGKVTLECKKNNIPMKKQVLYQTHSKSTAKIVELLYQVKYMAHDPNVLNEMLNVRMNGKAIIWDDIKKLGLI